MRSNLMEYLPSYYKKSDVMKNIQYSIAQEIEMLGYSTAGILEQLFIDTATWGLSLWEKQLGIKTDASISYGQRREVIKAKLRGAGTVTKEMLKNTALAYTNAEVDIIERIDDYSFVIKFISVKGVPKNMKGLIQTIEDIRPAHLNYEFQYIYKWWEHIKVLTWNEANNYLWEKLKEY